MNETRRKDIERTRDGWVSRGAGFYSWQEDESAALEWRDALTGEPAPRRPKSDTDSDETRAKRPRTR